MSSKDGESGDEHDLELEEMGVDEDVVSPETLEAIAALKASLEANPNQYEPHTHLIVLLKDAAMIEELRLAREAMSAAFPLSEELWIEWIEDESNMATSEDEKKHVLDLYERATSDYLSINIWKSYVSYAIQEYTESVEYPGNDKVVDVLFLRTLFRKADKATGHHVSQSHIVWDIQKDFELQQLSAQNPIKPEDVNKVKAMFLDRIAIPHSKLDETFSSLSSFISQYDGSDYENSMVQSNKIASAARSLLSKLEPFEEQLASTSNSLDTFHTYLDFELRHNRGHFSRVRTLYERAMAIHCLIPGLWNDYVTFLMSSNLQKKSHDLDPTDVLNIAKRSVRNCPWSSDLWENRLVLLELYKKPVEEMDAVLDSALSDGTLISNPQELSKVLSTGCSLKFQRASKDEDGHKQVREAFKQALTTIDAAGGDPYCKLERLWLEFESRALGDHDQARRLWKTIESKQKGLSDMWIAQADMEWQVDTFMSNRRLNNIKNARQVFIRACSVATTLDWPEKVIDAWLNFERESGDITTYKDALIRTRTAMKGVETLRAQAGAAYTDMTGYNPEPVANNTAVSIEGPSTSDNTKSKNAPKKRKLGVHDEGPTSKVAKTSGGRTEEAEADDPAESTGPVKPAKQAKSSQPLDISLGRHEDTCFVANFPADMTAAKLKELFQEYGTVLRCTMPSPRNEDLKKRAFAYVQFSSPEEAHAALALDGRDVGQRRGLSVKISDTDQKSRGTGAPPLPRVSRHEVHISGISNDLKEEELSKLISLYAVPTNVFMQRLAQSKGRPWANIKFDTEQDADAVLALNGTRFHGQELSVQRRVFQSANEGEGQQGLSRRERRKLAAAKKEQGEAEGNDTGSMDEEASGSTSTVPVEPSIMDRKEAEAGPQEGGGKGETSGSSAFKVPAQPWKPTGSTTSMMPRTMRPRSFQQTQSKPRSHLNPPVRAFVPASATASVPAPASSASAADTTKEVAAPKSNAEFRQMMLSGALKKKQP